MTPHENQLRKARRKPTAPTLLKDVVRKFINETCDLDPAASVLRSDLFARWQQWAIDHGIDPRSEAAFGRALRWTVYQTRSARHRVQGQQKRYYYGLTLKG